MSVWDTDCGKYLVGANLVIAGCHMQGIKHETASQKAAPTHFVHVHSSAEIQH